MTELEAMQIRDKAVERGAKCTIIKQLGDEGRYVVLFGSITDNRAIEDYMEAWKLVRDENPVAGVIAHADMYGGWITAEGEVIDCPDKCSHTRYADYGDANDEGWVCFTYGSAIYNGIKGKSEGMAIRFNPLTVTKRAVSSLARLINKSEEEDMYLSDMFTNCFNGYYCKRLTKKEAIKLIRNAEEMLTNDSIDFYAKMTERRRKRREK